MRQRNGSTLIELILSMIAGSGVMLLGISLVHQSMLLSELSGRRTDSNRKLDQLTLCFRRDVHAATLWTIDATGKLGTKCSDGSQVTYAVEKNAVTRERIGGPNAFERERFPLGEEASARFEQLTEPTRISLVVRNATGLVGNGSTRVQGRLDLKVESVPGRWITQNLHHLERSEGVQP